MPKRVIDFDAMWGSDKLASCAEWAQAEYAWFYGLADASGCFEVTNLRVIWGRVAAIRRNLTIERLEQVFAEFQDKGLLFVWEHEGKRYGHWTGSDVPGRLPPPSWRMRLERLAPPVPKQQFAEYVSRFARGRASLPGGAFRVESKQVETLPVKARPAEPRQVEPDQGSLKGDFEEAHAQDWNWNWNGNREGKKEEKRSASRCTPDCGETSQQPRESSQPLFPNLNSNSETVRMDPRVTASQPGANRGAHAGAAGTARAAPVFQARDKSFLAARELIVGQGPSCCPVKVKPEVLERIKARNAARDGPRSP
jgi:hypothetical protein